jgi:hypothetical protein
VVGAGEAVIYRAGREERLPAKSVFSASKLGDWRLPAGSTGIPEHVWQDAQAAHARRAEARATTAAAPVAPEAVRLLVEKREDARQARAWQHADALRDQIVALGWQVNDTPAGPELQPSR